MESTACYIFAPCVVYFTFPGIKPPTAFCVSSERQSGVKEITSAELAVLELVDRTIYFRQR